MKIILAGKSNLAVYSIIWLKSNFKELEIISVPSKSDLKNHGWQFSFRKVSEDLGVNIFNSINDIDNLKNSMIFSLEFDQIIDIDSLETNRIYNVHFSLLPKYRGVYTSVFPVLNEEEFSGVTIHKIDSKVDTGEIIDQTKFSIKGLTSFSIYTEYVNQGFELFKKNFENIFYDRFKTYVQNESQKSYYARRNLNFELRKINFKDINDSTRLKSILKIINSFYFPPYQYPEFNGKEIKYYKVLDTNNHDIGLEIIGDNLDILNVKDGQLMLYYG